jgi:hypothetical protein
VLFRVPLIDKRFRLSRWGTAKWQKGIHAVNGEAYPLGAEHRIGERYGKIAGQVALRWLVQQDGVLAIPRSSREANARSNLEVFDFELTGADMSEIFALGRPWGRMSDPLRGAPAWDDLNAVGQARRNVKRVVRAVTRRVRRRFQWPAVQDLSLLGFADCGPQREGDHLSLTPNSQLVAIGVAEMKAVAARELENRFHDFAPGSFDALHDLGQIGAIEDHQWPTWSHGSARVEPALHMTVREFAILRSVVREGPTKCVSIEGLRTGNVSDTELNVID